MTAGTAVVALYYIKTILKGLKSYSGRVTTPLKLVFYFQKCFQNYESAAIRAAIATVSVYY